LDGFDLGRCEETGERATKEKCSKRVGRKRRFI
jgi:hypothetical protein